MRHLLPIILIQTALSLALVALVAACGPKSTSGPARGSTAAQRTAPAKCPALDLSPKLRRQKTITRRIRKMVCGLQSCYEAAQEEVKDVGGTVRLSVTIDRGGRVEAIRLSAREVPASMTACVRAKILRWDFDIRDEPLTYGPFKIRF